MESWESTRINDTQLNSENVQYSDQYNKIELKSKIMTEELHLEKLSLNDSVYSVPILPKDKKCHNCEKPNDDKKLW